MDLINKDKLDDYVFKSASERMDLSVEYMSGWNDAIFHIKANTPTVDAEPVRHGKWIGYPECLRYENALTDGDYACSCCGEVFSCIDNDMERFDYCPHCGVKMDAQEDGECQTGLKEH